MIGQFLLPALAISQHKETFVIVASNVMNSAEAAAGADVERKGVKAESTKLQAVEDLSSRAGEKGITTTFDIAATISVIIWAGVILVLLFPFRKKLPYMVKQLLRRAKKLLLFEFSIELAALPEPPPVWTDPTIQQQSEIRGGDVYTTALKELFEKIKIETPLEYLIIDVKDGQFWFISRVFIFIVFLQSMRGAKCIVFVESKDDYNRCLIGIASSDAVRTALNEAYPWLEQALTQAMIKENTCFLTPSLPPIKAGDIIRGFIERPEIRTQAKPSTDDKWTPLGTNLPWEHTEWLTKAKITEYLRPALFDWDLSHYKDLPDVDPDERLKALLRRTAPYIALVNSKGEFKSLLNRQKLLEQVALALEGETQGAEHKT